MSAQTSDNSHGPAGRDWFVDLLRSCGQVLFADSALAGACLVLGMALYSGRAALFGVFGAALCSGFAALLLPRQDRDFGQFLHGANGLLLGGFWSWYFQVSAPSLFCLALAALATSALHLGLSRLFQRAALPVLSLPSNLALLAALMILARLSGAGALAPETLYLPVGTRAEPLLAFLPEDSGELSRLLRVYCLPSWLAILAGLAAYSGTLFRAALLGIGLGLALAVLSLPGDVPTGGLAGVAVFVGFNALPLALAIHGFFFPAGWRSLLTTCVGMLFCAGCWLTLGPVLGRHLLPFLTLPFIASLLAVLLAERLRIGWRSRSRPERATTPCGPLFLASPGPARDADGDAELEALLVLLRRAQRVSLLSGAGTSTESGIPDIRGCSPFWKDFPVSVFNLAALKADVLTHQHFREMDLRFQALILAAAPSGVHRSVRRLAELGRLRCVATQNVDGLFQRAGVPERFVRELHGTVFRLRCLHCGQVFPRPVTGPLPFCPHCGGFCITDMVFIGEAVDRRTLDEVLFSICSSDLLIVAGTSLCVDPAAAVCTLAAQRGVPVAILNLEPTPQDHLAGLVIRRPAGALLASAVERLEEELAGCSKQPRSRQCRGDGGLHVS